MQGNGSASLFAGALVAACMMRSPAWSYRTASNGSVVSGASIRGARVYVHAAAVGGDDVDDVELRLVGKHVRAAAALSRRVPRASLTGSS